MAHKKITLDTCLHGPKCARPVSLQNVRAVGAASHLAPHDFTNTGMHVCSCKTKLERVNRRKRDREGERERRREGERDRGIEGERVSERERERDS